MWFKCFGIVCLSSTYIVNAYGWASSALPCWENNTLSLVSQWVLSNKAKEQYYYPLWVYYTSKPTENGVYCLSILSPKPSFLFLAQIHVHKCNQIPYHTLWQHSLKFLFPGFLMFRTSAIKTLFKPKECIKDTRVNNETVCLDRHQNIWI